MTNSPSPVLRLYSRSYCHLCEDMLVAVNALMSEYCFEICVEDVDSDPALEALYDEKVPVLVAEGREICRYFFDEVAVRQFLESSHLSSSKIF